MVVVMQWAELTRLGRRVAEYGRAVGGNVGGAIPQNGADRRHAVAPVTPNVACTLQVRVSRKPA